MVQGINENLTPEQVEALRAGLVERARAVASASGGVLGVGKISSAEAEMIRQLESAFRTQAVHEDQRLPPGSRTSSKDSITSISRGGHPALHLGADLHGFAVKRVAALPGPGTSGQARGTRARTARP